MVVGKEEPTDLKLGRGKLKVKGKTFNVAVYGDRETKKATVFVPGEIADGKSPRKAKVMFKGKNITANLGFRTGRGGIRIPVYSFPMSEIRENPGNSGNPGSVMGGDFGSSGRSVMEKLSPGESGMELSASKLSFGSSKLLKKKKGKRFI